MKEALLILFGFVLAFVPNWLDRKRKLRSHWHAIKAEVSLIEEKAKAYLTHKVQAPLYRFPHNTYDTSFQMLLTEGALEENEVMDIERFYGLVKEINRGLDQIQGYLSQSDNEGMSREYNRNILKVKDLYEGSKDGEALRHQVNKIVAQKCSQNLIQY
jgi:hypothetical protein